jgi:hypothetical protein
VNPTITANPIEASRNAKRCIDGLLRVGVDGTVPYLRISNNRKTWVKQIMASQILPGRIVEILSGGRRMNAERHRAADVGDLIGSATIYLRFIGTRRGVTGRPVKTSL